MDVTKMGVAALSTLLAKGDISAVETAKAYLARIACDDPAIGAYLTVTEAHALKQAEAVDARRAQGEALPPLAGIPAAYKDNLCMEGIRMTCASRMLAGYAPPFTATAVRRLEAEGVVPLGKVNLDEFAMGGSTEHSALGRTVNPLDHTRVPGGSSGGSAAAVAAGLCAFALGSDTGGSIRQPAAFCGVVGMKPTYGAVSRYGLVAFASSLDQIGPLTHTVRDSALVLDALMGHDPLDATSAKHAHESCASQLELGAAGLTFALPDELFSADISPDVLSAVEGAARRMERLGAKLKRINMPALRHALPAYYLLSSAEASSNLARFDGIRYGHRAQANALDALYERTRGEGFGPEVQRRILLGTFALSSGYADRYYKQALRVRTLVSRAFDEAFAGCDLILCPTAPTVAYRLGEKIADPTAMIAGDLCTVPASIAGLPALSMPCGLGEGGLPVGLQWIGKPFAEATIYRAAHALEREGL